MKKKLLLFTSGISFLLALDQITKFLAQLYLADGKTVQIVPYFLDFYLIYNTGISLGLFEHYGNFWGWISLTSLTIIVICGLFFIAIKNLKSFKPINFMAFIFILGGALGNGFDRLFFKKVTDFLYFKLLDYDLFVFNLADVFISFGVFLIFLDIFVFKQPQENNTNDTYNII